MDRNGLRPSRFYITDDNILVMASEVGIYDVDPSKVILKVCLSWHISLFLRYIQNYKNKKFINISESFETRPNVIG